MTQPTPLACPRCSQLGIGQPGEHCSGCGAMMQPLRQQGLDGLRREYQLLRKPSYWGAATPAERQARSDAIVWLFAAIGQSFDKEK